MTIRFRQKSRTKNALIAAARELVTEGRTPTVEDAATRATISRTTAYRYFRNQAELLVAAHPEVQASSLLPEDAPHDPEARVDIVARKVIEVVLETEPQQRTMLRLSLESSARSEPLLLRQGRAIAWLEEALAPLEARITKAGVRRLALAMRTTLGIEALVWLTDVAGLSRARAAEQMHFAAMNVLRGAMASRAPRARRTSRRTVRPAR
jgi:AcrR family transcriptional regulator